VLVNCREYFFFDGRSSCSVTADVADDVTAYVNDVLFPFRKRFRLRMMFSLRKRFCLGNDVAAAEATWML
jgi:hypothetical protein